jgi:hypothetical protein
MENVCSFLGLRKQDKMQWLQDPNQSNTENHHNARRVASRHFKNKKRKHLKVKINKLETNSKNKNIWELYRGVNDCKKGYQPRTNIVKDEKGDLVSDCHSILTRWRNYFSQLLNVHGDKQTEIHTAEPLVPEPSAFEVEMPIDNSKDTNHTVVIRFQQNWIKQEVVTFALPSINSLSLFGINRNCLISGRSQSLYLFIRRVINRV